MQAGSILLSVQVAICKLVISDGYHLISPAFKGLFAVNASLFANCDGLVAKAPLLLVDPLILDSSV